MYNPQIEPLSTLMEVLAVSSSEVLHCRMLRWLLDPLARHGIGAMMLTDLFEVCELELADVAGVEVTVEETRERTRADVVVAPPAGGGVVIEAKVHAPERSAVAARLDHGHTGDTVGDGGVRMPSHHHVHEPGR